MKVEVNPFQIQSGDLNDAVGDNDAIVVNNGL